MSKNPPRRYYGRCRKCGLEFVRRTRAVNGEEILRSVIATHEIECEGK